MSASLCQFSLWISGGEIWRPFREYRGECVAATDCRRRVMSTLREWMGGAASWDEVTADSRVSNAYTGTVGRRAKPVLGALKEMREKSQVIDKRVGLSALRQSRGLVSNPFLNDQDSLATGILRALRHIKTIDPTPLNPLLLRETHLSACAGCGAAISMVTVVTSPVAACEAALSRPVEMVAVAIAAPQPGALWSTTFRPLPSEVAAAHGKSRIISRS